jgi:hypothetical protein
LRGKGMRSQTLGESWSSDLEQLAYAAYL